jgi:hypothetical protein
MSFARSPGLRAGGDARPMTDEPNHAEPRTAADVARRRAIEEVRARLEEISRHACKLSAVDGEPDHARGDRPDPR